MSSLRPEHGPQALGEPSTIVARPSLLACSRLVWCIVAALVAVVVQPRWGTWLPWLPAPLIVSAAVASGAWSACAWALASGLLLDALAPTSGFVGASAIPALVATLAVNRCRPWWRASPWVPAALGGAAVVVMQAMTTAMRAATSGALRFDAIHVTVSTLTTAILTAALAPGWVRWAARQVDRGRA